MTKVRAIPFINIRDVLHTDVELDDIRWAEYVPKGQMSNCVALYLRPAECCLPVFFESPKEKSLFVDVMKEFITDGDFFSATSSQADS